jgi:hypothetical protein
VYRSQSAVAAQGRAAVKEFSAEPGRIYLAEDLTGKCHSFRVVGANGWVALFVDFAQ